MLLFHLGSWLTNWAKIFRGRHLWPTWKTAEKPSDSPTYFPVQPAILKLSEKLRKLLMFTCYFYHGGQIGRSYWFQLSHFLFLLPILDLTGYTYLLTERMRFKARTDQTVKQEKEAKMQKTVINALGRNSLVAKADLGNPRELYKARDKRITWWTLV